MSLSPVLYLITLSVLLNLSFSPPMMEKIMPSLQSRNKVQMR